MFGVFPLSPAYGRDYKSAKEVEADFLAGKDFATASGQYCSFRDFPGQSVEIRYAKQRKVTVVQVPK
jgi:hypothetical protein